MALASPLALVCFGLLAFSPRTHATAIYRDGGVVMPMSMRRDDIPPPNTNTDGKFCEAVDVNDVDNVQTLWEDWGIGYWFDSWLQQVMINNKGTLYNWPFELAKFAGLTADVQVSGCGKVGGTASCAPDIDCPTMAANSQGNAYWVLAALRGLQAKIDSAHEALQDSVIDDILWMPEIENDFSAPAAWGDVSSLASIFSACFFITGSVAGVIGAGLTQAVASSSAEAAVARGNLARFPSTVDLGTANMVPLPNSPPPSPASDDSMGIHRIYSDPVSTNSYEQIMTDNQEAGKAQLDQAEKVKAAAEKGGRRVGATSAATYLLGSAMSVVSATAPELGQVEDSDLYPVLRKFFEQASAQLDNVGALASGSVEGGAYMTLPHDDGALVSYKTPIGGFFGDGRILVGGNAKSATGSLGATSPASGAPGFDDTLKAAYSTFRAKIVDQALITGLFKVIANEDILSKEACLEPSNTIGQQWMDVADAPNGGYCFALWRDAVNLQACPNDSMSMCQWLPATEADITNLQSKYGFNMYDYYKHAYECNKSGKEVKKPNLLLLPDDNTLPVCWFGLEAKLGKVRNNQVGATGGEKILSWDLFDF